jgi:fimbrial chaperone protein
MASGHRAWAVSARRLRQAALCTAVALAAGFVPNAWAGLFSVTPVRIFMTPRDRAVAITITNEGDEELVMQADIFTWKQKATGEDDLALTDDLILAPPIVKLAPRSRQVVRLARVNAEASPNQQTYRLVVREVPEARPADKNVQLQIALAFSMPVFVTPPSAKSELACSAERASADSVRVKCANTGNAYVQPREFTLLTAAGEKLAGPDNGGYILPSVSRSFTVKRAEGRIPAGNAKLAVTLDNGTTQSFDVKLGE